MPSIFFGWINQTFAKVNNRLKYYISETFRLTVRLGESSDDFPWRVVRKKDCGYTFDFKQCFKFGSQNQLFTRLYHSMRGPLIPVIILIGITFVYSLILHQP